MSEDKKIVFYGLSTCPYCRRAKEYLEDHKIPFELHYVDLLEGEERNETVTIVREYNPALSFPTIVIFIPGKKEKVYVGFTDNAREAVDAFL